MMTEQELETILGLADSETMAVIGLCLAQDQVQPEGAAVVVWTSEGSGDADQS